MLRIVFASDRLQVLRCACLFKHTGQFEKGVAEGAVDPSLNPVVALRLSVLKDSAVWAILSEVSQSHLPSVDVLHNKQWISMH